MYYLDEEEEVEKDLSGEPLTPGNTPYSSILVQDGKLYCRR